MMRSGVSKLMGENSLPNLEKRMSKSSAKPSKKGCCDKGGSTGKPSCRKNKK